jgi:hypothetical protein
LSSTQLVRVSSGNIESDQDGVLQKIINTLYISKYKGSAAKDLPDDVAKRNIFFGRRDMESILIPRTRLPVKVVPTAADGSIMNTINTMESRSEQRLREELAEQKEETANLWKVVKVASGAGCFEQWKWRQFSWWCWSPDSWKSRND